MDRKILHIWNNFEDGKTKYTDCILKSKTWGNISLLLCTDQL